MDSPINLIKASWQMFVANWKIITSILLAPIIIMQASTLLAAVGNNSFSFLSFVLSLGGIVLAIASCPALASAINRINNGEAASLSWKGQYKIGFNLFWAFILVSIIRGLTTGGGFALFIIPGIIIFIYTGFFIFTLVIDGKKGWSAFTESYAIVSGRWWATFGRVLILVALNMGFFKIAVSIVRGLDFVSGFSPESLSWLVVNSIFIVLLVGFMGSFSAVYLYRLYENLKRTRRQVETKSFTMFLIIVTIIGFFAAFSLAFQVARIIPKLNYEEAVAICKDDQKCIDSYLENKFKELIGKPNQ